jgi:hypothetical protein
MQRYDHSHLSSGPSDRQIADTVSEFFAVSFNEFGDLHGNRMRGLVLITKLKHTLPMAIVLPEAAHERVD